MENFKKNKRGFLLAEETLKIIIAVICVLFLVYILVAIYNSNSADKKIQEARGVLNRIDNITKLMGEGESQSQDVPNPSGWHIYTFVEKDKPNYCVNTNCICICQKTLIEVLKSQAKKCDDKGACLVLPKLAVSTIDIKIRNPDNLLFIEIKKQNGKIFIEERK